MKAQKFNAIGSPEERITIRLQVQTPREIELLTEMFKDTYALQKLVNLRPGINFSHEEVKHAADQIYIALVTNTI